MGLFGKNKRQKYIEKLEEQNKKREETSSVFTIGETNAEIQQRRKVENILIENRKMMAKKREERKKEEQEIEDQLFVINNAKIKMGSHMGTFKVLNNTPTIQGKTVGTKVEKSPANFSFLDGFQILSVTGDWQDIATAKYQDNEALIKKSTLMVTGKMPPPNAPIETGRIEFIDSGQINIPENINTTGMPVPENEQPPCIKEIKLYTEDEKEIELQNQICTPLYGEPFCIEIRTENIVDGTKIEISIKDTDINIKSIVITSNKGKTELISIPLKYYDESQENYDYEKHITTGKYKNFEFTFKVKNQPITSENNEITPYTYHRNYEELIGLFSIENDNSKHKDTNYENKFINQNIAIKNICNEFLENIFKKQNIEEITTLVQEKSKKMWEEATKQVQFGKLDDRPLYWARNKMQVALKRHYLFKNDIDFEKSIVKKNTNLEQIITILEEKSRNYTGIDFSKAPKDVKKVLITGFDPFQLNPDPKFQYSLGIGSVETFNLSGIVALALHNKLLDKNIYIQTCIFPVRYEDFDNNCVEKVIEKQINNVDMIMTTSLNGRNKNFDIEENAIAYRGGFHDNMCIGNTPFNSDRFIANKSTYINYTTLSVEKIFGKENIVNILEERVVYDIFCSDTKGAGGDYLSNEIMYRSTNVRNKLQSQKPVGHLHLGNINSVQKIIDITKKIVKKFF